jgi:hypothetical protein
MTGPTPMMFDHARRVYEAMDAEAVEESFEFEDEDGIPHEQVHKVYTGHLTTLFQRLELAMPYYTGVMKGLKALNCVEQLRRGGGTSQSKWVLYQAPTEQGWVDYDDNKRGGVRQGKTAMLEQQLRTLAERVQRIEDYLQQSPDLQKVT